MRQNEALEMLQKTMEQDMDQPVARKLLGLLGYLPLAICLAANFMKSQQLSVDEFYNLYQKKSNQSRILSSQFSDMGQDYDAPTSILGTFQISLRTLESRHPESTPLLHTMSFFDIDRIPFSLLEEQEADSLQLYDTPAPLTSVSLINTGEDSGVSIHRLVHAVIRETMDEETTMRFANEALRSLSAKVPSGDFAEWDVCTLLYPHAKALFEFRQIEDTNPEQLSLLFHNTGRYLLGRGEYWQAQEKSERAYYLRKKYFGPEHSLTLSSLRSLAGAFQSLGEYSKAQQLYEQALETMEKALGPGHPSTLNTVNNLESLYKAQGKLSEAEQMYQRALAKERTSANSNRR
jgi:tetratricopeptide (TPR) repeat protein